MEVEIDRRHRQKDRKRAIETKTESNLSALEHSGYRELKVLLMPSISCTSRFFTFLNLFIEFAVGLFEFHQNVTVHPCNVKYCVSLCACVCVRTFSFL